MKQTPDRNELIYKKTSDLSADNDGKWIIEIIILSKLHWWEIQRYLTHFLFQVSFYLGCVCVCVTLVCSVLNHEYQ